MVGRLALGRRSALAALAGLALGTPAAAASPRIAVMEHDLVEAMLTLGVAPFAVAEAERYRLLFTSPALPPACIELGASWEPNIELLTEIRPDIILASPDRSLLAPILDRVTTVVTIAPREGLDRYRRGLELLDLVGEYLGRGDAVRSAVQAIEHRLDAARQALAGTRWPPIYLAAFVEGGTHLEIYGPGCLLHDALTRLGLANAWTWPMPDYGWVVAGIERLVDTPEAIVILLNFEGDQRRIARSFQDSSLLQSLPVVAAHRVVPVSAASVWGGAPTVALFAERIAKGLGRMSGDR